MGNDASEKKDQEERIRENGQVTLTCGLTVKGTLSGSGEEGDLVKVTSSGMGKLSVHPASTTTSLSGPDPQHAGKYSVGGGCACL